MIEYNPALHVPPLHRIFSGLAQSVLSDQADIGSFGVLKMSAATYSGSVPWEKRRFRDFESAALSFVNHFGFLGSDKHGAEVESESVDYLTRMENQLTSFSDAHWNAEKPPEQLFDDFVGPNLRMHLMLKNGRLQVRYEPESLYAWMWLGVANDFSSGIRWDGPPCLFCLETMGRGPGGYRSDAKFCSSKCRIYFRRLTPVRQKEQRAKARELQRHQRED